MKENKYFDIPQKLSLEFTTFLKSMLIVNPKKRATAEELLQCDFLNNVQGYNYNYYCKQLILEQKSVASFQS